MRAWRTAGVAEFAFTTESIRFVHGTRPLRIAIASLAMMMLPLGLVMQFNPMGPHGVVPRPCTCSPHSWGSHWACNG